MTVFVDTNVLVYDTIENSQYHERAGELIDDAEDPIINSLSIIEQGRFQIYGCFQHRAF